MESIEAVEKALAVTNDRLAAMPSFGMYKSIQAQLSYLLGILKGTETDCSRLKQINFGVYAAKEFEDSDPEYARALHPAFWVATQMAMGLTVSNVPVQPCKQPDLLDCRRVISTLMLPKTDAYLASHPEIWDDGYLAFGVGPNSLGTKESEAVRAFFSNRPAVQARSGHGTHEIFVTQQALLEVDLSAGHRALVELVKSDLRMFSCRNVERATLEELASVFFAEMGACRVYSNTVVYASGERVRCLGPWAPTTKHSMDTLICAVNNSCVAYWLYGEDE